MPEQDLELVDQHINTCQAVFVSELVGKTYVSCMERRLHLVNVICVNKYCATATHATKLSECLKTCSSLFTGANVIALTRKATTHQAKKFRDPLTVAAGIVGMSTAKQPTSYRLKPSQTG